MTDRKYQPRPDAAFYKGKLPYFLAEVDSLDNENDKYRLYVQMACALKYALAFRQKGGKDNKFFLMGAFFSKEREIHRYFFYVNDAKKVRLMTSMWDSSTSHPLFARLALTKESSG